MFEQLGPGTYVPGADPGFFLGGGALVSCSTSTPINHIVFFLQNTSCIRKLQVIPGGGGGGGGGVSTPLHPPPRSALVYPRLKRASGLMVLHIKPAGDSPFNAAWDEQDNFYFYTLFCLFITTPASSITTPPPPPPQSFEGKLFNFNTGYPVKVWKYLPLIQWL